MVSAIVWVVVDILACVVVLNTIVVIDFVTVVVVGTVSIEGVVIVEVVVLNSVTVLILVVRWCEARPLAKAEIITKATTIAIDSSLLPREPTKLDISRVENLSF
uniref:Uncharacterized protein n=1 Tax=Ignisphaera aggregans TaxID=334771 RepID=A0A7C5YYZ4_9CREN